MKYNFDEIIDRQNTNSVKFEYRKEYFGDGEVIPMWVADMDFATPHFIRDAIIKRANHPVYGYTIRGKEFKESIISWMKRRHNWEVKKEWIVFSPGIVPAINLAVACYSEKGDKLLIQPPVYHPFFSAVKDHERILLENDLILKDDTYQIDYKDFEEKAKEAELFIFCHPHNPVGRLWEREDLEKIVSICRENNVIILSDEIHSDLILTNRSHIPLLHIEGSDKITAAFYAPSKTFNLAGLSTSFLIIPDEKLRQKFEKQINTLHLGMGNLFGNVALEAAYNYGEEWLGQLIDYLRNNFSFLTDFISSNIPIIKVVNTEATYLVWLDFRELKRTDTDLRKFIISKAGLGLNDGPTFGKSGSGFQRINIATPLATLKEALKKLEKAINEIDGAGLR